VKAPIAFAEREGTFDIGREMVVDRDEAASVPCNSCLLEAEVIRVGAAPDSEQHVTADHVAGLARAVKTNADFIAVWLKADALGVQPDRNIPCLAFQAVCKPRTSACTSAAP
jgi:hypothetical protein